MKGIVFTEFLDMVENQFGYEVVDHIIEVSDLESKGVYTAVGTYPHSEVVALLTNLSKKVQLDPGTLLKEFGKHLFDTFLRAYPQFFNSVDNLFDFLASIDNHIHVEVKKLYPDAALPKFDTHISDDKKTMNMTYRSERSMSVLAEGLIEKSMDHFKEPCEFSSTNLKEDGSVVEFILKKL